VGNKRIYSKIKVEEYNYSEAPDKAHTNNRSERDIWIEFKQGSDSALAYIYRNYVQSVYNYGFQIIRDEDFVQDCIQDLFMDMIKKRDKLGDVQNIKFYLFTAIRRRILRKLKKERRHPIEQLDNQTNEKFEIVSSPEVIMINNQLDEKKQQLLSMACSRLTEKQREAILLYYYEGFSYKQVAEILGMNKVKSVRVLIYRTIDILQSHLLSVKDQIFILVWIFLDVNLFLR
jgi:RNA polymerase sigma-70 factor (ECF subfamily)